jgi:hypothetical protein
MKIKSQEHEQAKAWATLHEDQCFVFIFLDGARRHGMASVPGVGINASRRFRDPRWTRGVGWLVSDLLRNCDNVVSSSMKSPDRSPEASGLGWTTCKSSVGSRQASLETNLQDLFTIFCTSTSIQHLHLCNTTNIYISCNTTNFQSHPTFIFTSRHSRSVDSAPTLPGATPRASPASLIPRRSSPASKVSPLTLIHVATSNETHEDTRWIHFVTTRSRTGPRSTCFPSLTASSNSHTTSSGSSNISSSVHRVLRCTWVAVCSQVTYAPNSTSLCGKWLMGTWRSSLFHSAM